jgi:hypothetical protein
MTTTVRIAAPERTRSRQRVLALPLPIAAVLYIGAEAVSPKGTDTVIDTVATALKVLPIASHHPAQLYLASSLALSGLGALAVSYAAIAMLVRDRGATLATVAALIGGIGAFCGAIANVLAYPVLDAAATAHVPAGSAAKILVTGTNSDESGTGTVYYTDASTSSFTITPDNYFSKPDTGNDGPGGDAAPRGNRPGGRRPDQRHPRLRARHRPALGPGSAPERRRQLTPPRGLTGVGY